MSGIKRLEHNPEWISWIKENVERGCDRLQLKQILLQNGFDAGSVDQALTQCFTKRSKLEAQSNLKTVVQVNAPQVYYAKPISTEKTHLHLISQSSGESLYLQDPLNPALVSQVLSSKMQLYLIADFMSVSECEEIIRLGNPHLRASTVSMPDLSTLDSPSSKVQKLSDQTYVDLSFRTSQTCDLALLNHPSVSAMDQKIAKTLGVNVIHSEGTQLQRYCVGEQFKAHTDYFTPNTEEYARFAAERGNRTWTFMVYLNEVKSGGETQFLSINKSIRPRQGMAVVWNNLLPSGEVNPQTLHAGLPVLEGEKFVITKWFREGLA